MTHIKSVPFEFEGKHYEVRVILNNGVYQIKAFIGDTPANGYGYTVEEMTNADFHHQHGLSAVQHMIEVAQADVENKIWEKYVAAVNELQK